MAGEFVYTLADASQFEGFFNGSYMKGRREPRIAWVGRSNVGKSSLIRAILGPVEGGKGPQVSNQPGKTRAIHFYYWREGKKVLADLPGFGFALASAAERARWEEFINLYLEQDEGLERAMVLLDARHGPTESDADAIRFLSGQQVPMTFVFTKWDAVKTQSERAKRVKEANADLLKIGQDPSTAFWISAKNKDLGFKRLVQELTK